MDTLHNGIDSRGCPQTGGWKAELGLAGDDPTFI